MSRVCVFIVLFTVLGLYPCAAAAQPDIGRVTEVYTTAGISKPVSPRRFKDLWNGGNHMTAGIGIEGGGVFVLRMGFRYNTFLLDTAAVRAAAEMPDEVDLPASRQFYVFGTTFDLMLDVPTPVNRLSPYLLVGLSIYHTDLGDMAIEEGMSPSDVREGGQVGGGMNVGVGLSHMLTSEIEPFVEYMLIGGFAGGDKKVFTPLSIGVAIHL